MTSVKVYRPIYDDVLKEIEYIQDNKHINKDYHAFVYWFIATLYGEDEHATKAAMCDGTHDKGVDAVLIDKVERTVSVFQSKFERNGNKTQLKENDVKLLATVKEYFKSRSALVAITSNANPATRQLLESAYQELTKSFTLELIFITTHKINPAVEPLIRKMYQFTPNQFRIFCYDNILAVMADKSRDFLPMNSPYNLPYTSADGVIVKTGSSNSWVLTVKANDIRDMVINYPSHLLFRKNYRDYLTTRMETNRRMLDTLKDEQEQRKFWFYNNGITILCDSATLSVENKYIHLMDPEVINGCQTVMTIHQFKEDSEAEVLVRIVAARDHRFMDSMILYQNSSNPVLKRDFKSNDPVQVRLHHEFFKHGWYYEIKRGQEFEKMAKEDRNIKDQCEFEAIRNSDVAKALASIRLHPSIAASQGDDYFFGEKYQDIFTQDTSTFNCLGPFLFREIIYKSFFSERFHSFEKAWIFKNPGTYFILSMIYKYVMDSNDLEKKWVTFWEEIFEDDKEWKMFNTRIIKVIKELFEVSYKGWRRATKIRGINHNAFFKNEKEVEEMIRIYEKPIKLLQTRARYVFQKDVFKAS
jgi:hypothetical protein